MKKRSVLVAAATLLSVLAFATDYNLGTLAKSNAIELFNRKVDETQAAAPDILFLSSGANYVSTQSKLIRRSALRRCSAFSRRITSD